MKGSSAAFRYKNSARSLRMGENFDALLFDCDGVIAETERDVHRVAFNEAFKDKGLNTIWDEKLYGELLKIGGGKERMTAHFDKVGWPEGVTDDEKSKFVQELHSLKTSKFEKLVISGAAPLRPGVKRLVDEAMKRSIQVAVCSTSNEEAVKTIVRTLLGERFARMRIFAGDMVSKKKPSPDVYLLAAKELEIDPSRCWVIEDSEIGLKAALSAGMKCVVTKSVYTENETFEGAEAVIKDLDNGIDGPVSIAWLNYKANVKEPEVITSALENANMFAATPDYNKMFKKVLKGEGSPFG
eukprot:CAMPEP_0182418246 /NCGR_PEP_ID=MMETSP1167-20130531/2735_1 /TAXON_ID=2988 /ORGANISM="Mallomonas Sp, Strain CCMP3275" /LENGTH=297 /DNA_ID=CAMNT_0024592377 /DNA_START=103 /DNA_END=996 /DNA_ORIENTATION=+